MTVGTYLLDISKYIVAVGVIGGGLWSVGEATGYRPFLIGEAKELTVAVNNTIIKETSGITEKVRGLQAQVDDVTKLSFQIKLELLLKKQETTPLTFEEQDKVCYYASVLKWKVPGC